MADFVPSRVLKVCFVKNVPKKKTCNNQCYLISVNYILLHERPFWRHMMLKFGGKYKVWQDGFMWTRHELIHFMTSGEFLSNCSWTLSCVTSCLPSPLHAVVHSPRLTKLITVSASLTTVPSGGVCVLSVGGAAWLTWTSLSAPPNFPMPGPFTIISLPSSSPSADMAW